MLCVEVHSFGKYCDCSHGHCAVDCLGYSPTNLLIADRVPPLRASLVNLLWFVRALTPGYEWGFAVWRHASAAAWRQTIPDPAMVSISRGNAVAVIRQQVGSA